MNQRTMEATRPRMLPLPHDARDHVTGLPWRRANMHFDGSAILGNAVVAQKIDILGRQQLVRFDKSSTHIAFCLFIDAGVAVFHAPHCETQL